MRTFIAIELPTSLQDQIGQRQQILKTRLRADGLERLVRWTAVEKMHLTLRFLGETDEMQRRSVAMSLETIVAAHPPFSLGLDILGCFPNCHRPSVIWLGMRGDLEPLSALQARIEEAARAAGFEADKRPYTPHLTIARIRRQAGSQARRKLGQALQDTPLPAPPPPFTVDRIAFIQSVLKPSGAVYTALGRYPLA
jgi:2'-5' RNA ligase